MKLYILLGAFILSSIGFHTHDGNAYIDSIADKTLNQTTIPIELVDNKYLLIDVTVNNKTLKFYFDTGATATLIDSKTAKELGIESNFEQQGMGADGPKTFKIAMNQAVQISDIDLLGMPLVFEDLSRLKEASVIEFDGIIGYSLLNLYTIEVDIENRKMSLYTSESEPNKEFYSEHPFSLDNGIPIPQMKMTFILNDDSSYEGNVLFDSGAGLTLLVSTPFKENNNLLTKSKKVYSRVSNSLSKTATHHQISIKSLQLYDYIFKDLPINLSSSKNGISADSRFLGFLGAEIIYRFNFILDYKNQKIYLKPNKTYKGAFNFPTTGISIKKNKNDEIYITQLSIESDAYKQGIREGDIISSINSINNNDLNEYRKLLKSQSATIHIKIKHKKAFKITPKRLI